jgi:TM2 domain-containing membrane protein YozV
MGEEKEKYCPHCGTLIPYKELYCPLCGEKQPQIPGLGKPRTSKNKWIALILSLLITGLGQLYLRKYRRAGVFLGGTLIIGILLRLYFSYEKVLLFGALISVISAWDAYQLAQEIND